MTGSLSLERGLAVLEALKEAHQPLGVREIARQVQLSAPAVQRLLNTLCEFGYVEQSPDTKRYLIGRAVLALAQQLLQKDPLVGLAEPELLALASRGCFNSFLGARRGSTAIYLMAIQSQSPVVIRSSPGESLALHSTALGKALLLGHSKDEMAEILSRAPLQRVTPRTMTDVTRLIEQLHAAQAIGYTTSLDENILGVISIGAPIHNASGAVVAAISVAYPRSVGPQVVLAEIGEHVLAAARRISLGLGYDASATKEGGGATNAA